jgi:hypothetical protein
MASPYVELAPPPRLARWVRCLWRYRDDAPSGVIQRIPPDGCPELILHLGRPYEEMDGEGRFRPQPVAVFAGQMTRPLCLRAAGPIDCVGLRFEPDGARPWFGSDLSEATDRRRDVSARIALPTQRTPEAALAVLQGEVESALERAGWPANDALRADISDPDGAADPASRRRLQRLYLREVGVSARMLQSVFRFRRVFDRLQGEGADWLSAALEAGYFDQPQMARDFRRFLDCTATQWAREQVEIAKAIASASQEKSGGA